MERTPEEKLKAVKLISEKIMQTAYRSILLEMRFIDVALGQLKPKPHDEVEYLGTNGKTLFYNQIEVVKRYQKNPIQVNHDVVHLLMHCVFKHLFYQKSFLPYWDLACDITVEQLISTLKAPCLKVNQQEMQGKLTEIEKVVGQFTPHNVMTYLQLKNLSEEEVEELEELFHFDDHDFWHIPDKTTGRSDTSGEIMAVIPLTMDELKKIWSNISLAVELNMISFYKQQGDMAGGLQQKLKQLNREPYDYSKFLKKFAQRLEVTKVNHDEFDYIFYTYGLNMYENMPLIEPLEYKDSHIIRDFVIAIDTSGSTSGDVVQKFLQKTYNILKSSESFSQTINLYIIQCDAKIQEVAHIKSQVELEEYIQNLSIKGLGGTDFRPVFGYVRKLLEEKAFTKLKGLIYFTDGYGDFPKEKTPYDTAFVFVVPEDYEQVTVPPWAMKVLLTENEIKEFQEEK
ncbi:MAG: VWA-like domain-containing protein [Eubacteriales bacterium]